MMRAGGGAVGPERERTISVRTLGAFELAFDGVPVDRWKAGKARNLLQFLLLRPGHVVARNVLYESLWPDASWSKDSSSLKVAAHMLRSLLDRCQGEPAANDGPALRLLTRESGYVLVAHGVWIDLKLFEQLVAEAHAAQRTDRAVAARLYRRAVALYQDDYLPDVRYDWAVAQREWLRSRLLCACAYLTETSILGADHLGVIRWCQRMLDVEPFHEETFRALMLVHGHLGELTQVDRWYRLCVARLRGHLQVSPDLATRRIHTRAVRGEYTGRPIDPRTWQRELQPMGYASLLRMPA
jgi:DNA-binding SARP family transcriptional activator